MTFFYNYNWKCAQKEYCCLNIPIDLIIIIIIENLQLIKTGGNRTAMVMIFAIIFNKLCVMRLLFDLYPISRLNSVYTILQDHRGVVVHVHIQRRRDGSHYCNRIYHMCINIWNDDENIINRIKMRSYIKFKCFLNFILIF